MSIIDYSSHTIIPQFSDIGSREDCDITTNLGGIILKLPIISANMKTVTGPTMALAMHKAGGMGILHRFSTIYENIEDYLAVATQIGSIDFGVTVGVKELEYERAKQLLDSGAKIICIDVAHGHNSNVYKMIEFLKNYDPITIIAGNVATAKGASDLYKCGANIIKVGIGPGFACTTRKTTGVGVPQLYAIKQIKDCCPEIPLIADGGVKTVSDIAKAIAVGADAVMVGAVLAGTTETPGEVYPDDSTDLVNRTYYKMYGGSSSAQNKGENRFVEGRVQTIPFKGHVKYILKEIKEGLQSSLSYVGARNIKEFRSKVEFLET